MKMIRMNGAHRPLMSKEKKSHSKNEKEKRHQKDEKYFGMFHVSW